MNTLSISYYTNKNINFNRIIIVVFKDYKSIS